MPHKADIPVPDWVARFEEADPCLYIILTEAYVVRNYADKAGAFSKRRAASVMHKADAALQEIRRGVVRGGPAQRRATDALRKFTAAWGAVDHKQSFAVAYANRLRSRLRSRITRGKFASARG